jgi:hypothetical protein
MALPSGVPPLLNAADIAAFPVAVVLLVADTFIDYGLGQPPLWGVFLNGLPVVTADTVTSFDYRQDWAVSDYPVERGGFESYDKVNQPFRTRIQFASGGSQANRQVLIDSIAAIGDALTLFDVVTPEEVYIGVNVDHYDYRRTASNGVGLVVVDVEFLEIREDGVTNTFQNAQVPSGFAPAPTGNVQSTDQTGVQSLPPAVN